MRVLLLLFVATPIVEMFILIKVGGIIGAPATIAMVLLTAMVGLALLKRQGMSTIMHAQQKMDSGELPINEIVEGVFLAVGGALLLTPGFVTDAIGFCCLLPGLRHLIIRQLIIALKPHIVTYRESHQTNESHVIDGEFRREDK
ncbi:MAG: FxsA family protein [Agarilytica sp.]